MEEKKVVVDASSHHRLWSLGWQRSTFCHKGRSRKVRGRIFVGTEYSDCRIIRSGQLPLGERAARSSRASLSDELCLKIGRVPAGGVTRRSKPRASGSEVVAF